MTYRVAGLGWLPDPLDHRDLTLLDAGARERLNRIAGRTSAGLGETGGTAPADVGNVVVDLRPWCSPVERQGQIGSCTAHAVVGALEYFEHKTRGEFVDASRLFLYRVTRRYLGWEGRGDTGAFVRSAIKALRLFGAVPEAYFPYDETAFDREPEAFHYAFGQNFKALEYYRVPENPNDLRAVLELGLPVIFGFTCFTSLMSPQVKQTGIVRLPAREDSVIGGHAVLGVGYTQSHLLFRNSWGEEWGDGGYGYLPWSYFDAARPLATDCWVLVNASFIEDGDDGQPIPATVVRALGKSLTRGRSRRELDALDARVRVSRGEDPLRKLPFSARGRRLEVDQATPIVLPRSPRPLRVTLKELRLSGSFDFALFGERLGKLFVAGVVWDLSGKPPRILPPQPTADADHLHELEDMKIENKELWQDDVVGALYVRLLLLESEGDRKRVVEQVESIRSAVLGGSSELAPSLAALGAKPDATRLAAVARAADDLVSVIAKAARSTSGDVVSLFDGVYGAQHASEAREEREHQSGTRIALSFGDGSQLP